MYTVKRGELRHSFMLVLETTVVYTVLGLITINDLVTERCRPMIFHAVTDIADW